MKSISEFSAAQIMAKDIFFVKETESLVSVMKRMGEKNCSSAIVEKEGDRDTHGIITRKDIVIEAAENLESFPVLKARDLATKPVISIQATSGVDHVIRLMRLAGVRRVMVYDGAKLVGIISNSDIFKLIYKLLSEVK